VLRAAGHFEHDGQRITHPGLHAAFLRGVRFVDDPGVFVVQVGHFRGQIEVEDTPWWVVLYDSDTGEIELTDRTREPLRSETLVPDADGALRCGVKERFAARFTHAGQALLLDAADVVRGVCVLRAGDSWLEAPGLDPEA